MKKRILCPATILTFFAAFLFVGGCAPDYPRPVETSQNEYAIDSLPVEPSNELDQEILAGLVSQIRMGVFGRVHSLIIIHKDSLVMEEYFRGWTRHMLHPCFSATKSITSALIGIAINQGHIAGVDENLLGFFPEYNDIQNRDARKESITLEQVLTMSPGFTWDEMSIPYVDFYGNPNPENDAMKMHQSSDWIKHVLDLPMSDDPGTECVYNSGATTLLSGIITNTTGQSAEDFAEENLFTPLGITDWDWETGPNGITNTGWGLFLHPVDMAMFGYLYLNNGLLNGEQIVPEDWVEESTAQHIVYVDSVSGADAAQYGYQWWEFLDDLVEGFVESNDLYYAFGFGGQFIFVVPHLDMVVATTAWDMDSTKLYGLYPALSMLFGYIIPAAQ